VIVGGNATFSVSVSGTGPFTYQWQLNGTNLPTSIITTVAGNGTVFGDGGAATNAAINYSASIAVDASGNLFIADQKHNRVRKVNSNGIITTFAGSGNPSYSGDEGAATNATLNGPTGVALNTSGDLFIADRQNNRIRKVSTNGTITTVAGNGSGYFSGDSGSATNAALNWPNGVVVDASGNLFIADQNNCRIRKVNINGIITTVAGNGNPTYSGDGGSATNAALYFPAGVAVDGSGNVFIADSDNNRLRKVSANGIITTVAGNGTRSFSGDGGAATNATLSEPTGIGADASGNLFLTDWLNCRVRKINANGTIVTVAGSASMGFSGDGGAATNAALYSPNGVAVDSNGNLFIADSDNNRIRKVNANGIITTVAGNGNASFAGDGGAATNASLNFPYAIALDTNANLFIADYVGKRICKVNAGGVLTTVAGGGTYSGDGGAALNAALSDPSGVAVDNTGNLFIADPGANRIRKVNTNGIISTVAGNGTASFSGDGGPSTNATVADPFGIAIDGGGNLFISDTSNNRVRKANSSGTITTFAGNGTASFSGDGFAATNAALYNPNAVTKDASGNLFVADLNNHRVRKVATNGIITTVAGNGDYSFYGDNGAATNAALTSPSGVAVDASGNLFIADQNNNRVRKVDSRGVITTIAGNGTRTFSGDCQAGTSASLNLPSGLALDAAGNLFIADYYNNRVRRMNISGLPSLSVSNVSTADAGNYSVIIFNASGSVTSSVARLIVAPTGYRQVSGQLLGNGKMRLSFVGLAGTNYALDRSFSLAPVNWIPEVTNSAGSGGALVFTNTPNTATNNFWRIRSVP
jgi:sugar lactone lactonase YvrE